MNKSSHVQVTVTLRKETYEAVNEIITKTGRNWSSVVDDALNMWILTIDPVTGMKHSAPAVVSLGEPQPPTCPHCGRFVIYEDIAYAPLGFCLNCGDVTVSEDEVKQFQILRERFWNEIKKLQRGE